MLLVVAVFFGNRMGDRVLSQVGARIDLQPTPIPSIEPPSAGPSDERRVFWKKAQVVTAATDPAFPDPRVTPPPTATPRPPTPIPTPPPPKATPTVSPSPAPTVLLTPVPPPASGEPAAANGSAAPNASETP